MNGRIFFYIRNTDGVITGPFSSRKIQEMKAAGRIKPEYYLSRDGVTWERVSPIRQNETPTLSGTDDGAGRGHMPAPPTPEQLRRGACDVPRTAGNSPGDGHNGNSPGDAGSIAGNASDFPEEEGNDDGMKGEGVSGLALWSKILWFSWDGARHFQALREHPNVVCRWVLPYSFAACVAPWLIFPPEKTLFSSAHLLGLLLGMVSWCFILLVSLLSPILLSWFSGERLRLEKEEMLASLHTTCVFSVFYGNVILFRKCLLMSGMSFWIPAIILGVLLVWCVGVQKRMVCRLVKERGQASGWRWMPSCLVPAVLFLEVTIIVVFIFGGFK